MFVLSCVYVKALLRADISSIGSYQLSVKLGNREAAKGPIQGRREIKNIFVSTFSVMLTTYISSQSQSTVLSHLLR
jgi:hypothetical protein